MPDVAGAVGYQGNLVTFMRSYRHAWADCCDAAIGMHCVRLLSYMFSLHAIPKELQ